MKKTIDWDNYTAQLVSIQRATATDSQLLNSYARGSVLEAGCGTGIRIGRLAALEGIHEAVGVDLGKPGLSYGKNNFPNVNFIEANLYKLPFQDNHFDLVYSIDVVEHLDTPKLAIKELHRVCKPDGFVFIQTPNYPIKRVYDLWHWLRGSKDSPSDDPTHVYFFNSFSLKKMVSDVGLNITHLSARNIAFQSILPGRKMLLKSSFGLCFGQKTIIIATKP
jgi:ubiquinone/menaquinone biosynthesis C-methylase UbiE